MTMAGGIIGVVGNPNCGKTTLFNALTGARQQVGNWPGVTVEKKVGRYEHHGAAYTIVDLPGVYSLGVTTHSSEDERVARDYVLAGEATLIVNIVDASNLERNLYLTTQLLEMRVPLIVALNMMDIARDRRIQIDTEALSRRLGCPVVPVVASRRRGLDGLKTAVAAMAARPSLPTAAPTYHPAVEQAVTDLAPSLSGQRGPHAADPRWLALKLLEGDLFAQGAVTADVFARAEEQLAAVADAAGEDADILIADGRFAFVATLMAGGVKRLGVASRTLSDGIDRIVLNRVLGIPVFLGMMYLMFMCTINVGGAFIDFFDQVAGTLLVEEFGALLTAAGAPDWLKTILADGIGGGFQTVATFIPIVGFLFLFLAVLEDSGYMARAAFVMDRAMRAIGLPGKSFVPLLVGFGCNVPAVMATRTLEHRRDRIMTAMMTPFMSCGARLPVYALFAAAFFPVGGQNVVFSLYLVGLAFAIGTGLMLKSTLLRGDATPFVMELPPYHLPTLPTVARRAWDRLGDFVLRAGKVIVAMVLVLNLLNSMGADGRFDKQGTPDSLLARAGTALIPLFAPMGLSEGNWPAAVGLFTGIFAKEAVVGTLNTLYAQAAEAQAPADAAPDETVAVPLTDRLMAAVLTIPTNLAGLADKMFDPLGMDVSFADDATAASEQLEVDAAVFDTMRASFDGALGAYAYLLLVLLYTPCVAAAGAIVREIGTRWAVFSAVWTTALSYATSVVVYQAGTFSRDPAMAGAWIAGCLGAIGLGIVVLRQAANRSAAAPALAVRPV